MDTACVKMFARHHKGERDHASKSHRQIGQALPSGGIA